MKDLSIKQHIAAAAVLCACVFAGSASAQAVKLVRPGEKVNPDEIAKILSAPSLKMRGANPSSQTSGEPQAVALMVQFGFDSATIQPQARGQLDALAEAIQKLDSDVTVIIEGHTDRHGRDTYNVDLSTRRAEAVKTYLVQRHNIDAKRLDTEGKGAADPVMQANPFAAENRRVQFRAAF